MPHSLQKTFGQRADRIPKVFFWLITFLLFAFPYMTFVSVCYSIPLICLWFLLNSKKIFSSKEGVFFCFFVVLMVISSSLSAFYFEDVRWDTDLSTSFKRTLMFSAALFSYLFYRNSFNEYKLDIENFVFSFSLIVFLFAVLYYVFPTEYATTKIALSPVDNHTRRYLAGSHIYRFNYLWTDPNNVAYMMAGINAWFLQRTNVPFLKKALVSIATMFIIGATCSNGGLVCFVITIILMGVLYFKRMLLAGVDYKKLFFAIGFVSILLFSLFNFTNVSDVVESFANNYERRIESYVVNGNVSGGRVADLEKTLDYVNPMFLVIGSGKEGFSAENGHLYLICMYGFITYILFMKLLFFRTGNQQYKDYVWIFPFFAGFTMNIAIIEYKYLGILLFLLAESRYNSPSPQKTLLSKVK